MKMDSAWDLVVEAWKVKGRDPRELRLQRHIALYIPAAIGKVRKDNF